MSGGVDEPQNTQRDAIATMARPTYPGILSLTSQLRVTLASASDTGARGIVKKAKKNACRERGTVMRAVVVYESMFGNTRQIADAIGTGLVDGCVVSVIPPTTR